jgi:exonuclease III
MKKLRSGRRRKRVNYSSKEISPTSSMPTQSKPPTSNRNRYKSGFFAGFCHSSNSLEEESKRSVYFGDFKQRQENICPKKRKKNESKKDASFFVSRDSKFEYLKASSQSSKLHSLGGIDCKFCCVETEKSD